MPADVTEILRGVPLLARLPDSELAGLAGVVRERRSPKGAVIVSQGNPGEALFLIRSGQVKVTVIAEDGREVILSVQGPGGFFGEMSLLDDEPRSAHVIAMEDTVLLVLRREEFQARLQVSPGIGTALLRELSRRLRRADEVIAGLMLLDVNGRIAHLLLELAREEGGQQGAVITRRLTHAAIGQMVGASRETVSRTMRMLVNGSVIAVSRKEIRLLERDVLRLAARESA